MQLDDALNGALPPLRAFGEVSVQLRVVNVVLGDRTGGLRPGDESPALGRRLLVEGGWPLLGVGIADQHHGAAAGRVSVDAAALLDDQEVSVAAIGCRNGLI